MKLANKILHKNIFNISTAISIEKFILGDNDTLKHIYGTLLKIFYYKMKNSNGSYEDARNIFQDVLLALYSGLSAGKLKISGSFENYLLKCCMHRWENLSKKINMERMHYDDYQYYLQSEPVVDQHSENRRYESLQKNISKLTVTNRQMVELVISGKSNKEIAWIMDFKNLRAVENKKHRIIEQLQKRILAN